MTDEAAARETRIVAKLSKYKEGMAEMEPALLAVVRRIKGRPADEHMPMAVLVAGWFAALAGAALAEDLGKPAPKPGKEQTYWTLVAIRAMQGIAEAAERSEAAKEKKP